MAYPRNNRLLPSKPALPKIVTSITQPSPIVQPCRCAFLTEITNQPLRSFWSCGLWSPSFLSFPWKYVFGIFARVGRTMFGWCRKFGMARGFGMIRIRFIRDPCRKTAPVVRADATLGLVSSWPRSNAMRRGGTLPMCLGMGVW